MVNTLGFVVSNLVIGVSMAGVAGVITIIIVIPVIIIAIMYNSLVGKRNQVSNVFASIDALLKKRYDLVPNIVAAVKGYMTHEAGVFTKITELRTKAVSGQASEKDKIQADSQITPLLSGLMISVENYPNLKASENFLQLQRTLNEVEEQLSAARRAFNASVNDYNNAVQMFPTNIIAGMANFPVKEYFTIPGEEKKSVNVGEMLKK